jgi:hypothetical protein
VVITHEIGLTKKINAGQPALIQNAVEIPPLLQEAPAAVLHMHLKK